MLQNIMLFAGPICFNPNTERESFMWGLVAGACLLGLLSLIFVLIGLTVKSRNTFNNARKNWAKRYKVSVLAFFLLMSLGWLTSTGGTANDYCRTAQSSAQGNILQFFAFFAILAAAVSLVGFLFSFTKNRTK